MAVAVKFSLTESWSAKLEEAARRAGDLSTPLVQTGELLLGVVRRNFEQEGGPDGKWPPLSEATLLQRARGRSGRAAVFYAKRRTATGERAVRPAAQAKILGAKPLILTARLLRSIAYQVTLPGIVDVGSNVVYAARQFFGSKRAQRWGKRGPVVSTPARNPFGLTDQDREEIRKIFSRFLFSSLWGGQ